MNATTGFAGLPICTDLSALEADVAVVGASHAVPYGAGVTSHSAGAPAAIRAAIDGYSLELHHYDFDLGGPLLGDGSRRAVDCGDIDGDAADPDGNIRRIRESVGTILDSGAVPVVLGGDDSIAIPVFQAFEGHGPLTVVQVDAHIDWRHEVHGETRGYSSTMRRASEMPWVERIVQVGARGVGSARPGEVADAREWGATFITAREVYEHGVAVALECVPDGARCVVTVDCDGLDPAVMPAVMAREPGGLTYRHMLDLIHGLATRKHIAGFNLVELAPSADIDGMGAVTAARIVCNAIGAIIRQAP